MAQDDLDSHARSSQDYYALLEIAEGATETEIRKAYRRTALKYHPDKAGGDPAAVEKFHLLSIANDVLSDPSAKAIYDHGRQARREKELRESAFSDRRRRMKEDLERRESGIKRSREEDEEEDKLQAEIRRLQADGARRRYERMEKLRKEQEEEEAKSDEADAETDTAMNGHSGSTEVPEMERAIKIRYGCDNGVLGKEDLSKLFSRFGEIDMVIMLKDKTNKGPEMRRIGTATIVFVSMASAHAAVEDKKEISADFPSLESIAWAKGEPQAIKDLRMRSNGSSTPTTPKSEIHSAQPSRDDTTRIRLRMAAQRRKAELAGGEGGGLRKVPSFASFKAGNTPQKMPASPLVARDVERRRLADELRRREEQEDGL